METPELRFIGFILYSLSEVAAGEGDVIGAISQLRESLTYMRKSKYALGAGNCERLLGVLHRQQGYFRAAIQHLNTAITDFEVSGHQINVGFSAFELVQAHLQLGEVAEATTAFDRVAAVVKKAGSMWTSGPSLNLQGRGHIAMHCGDLEEAQLAFESAAEEVARHGNPDMEYYVQAIRGLADVHKRQGNLEDARNYFVVCAIGQRKLQEAPLVAEALAGLAEVVDDDAAGVLVESMMLPLLRFGFQGNLASLLVCSAKRAKAIGLLPLARSRATAAISHYKTSDGEYVLRTANELLA